jgi:hypothetical protein
MSHIVETEQTHATVVIDTPPKFALYHNLIDLAHTPHRLHYEYMGRLFKKLKYVCDEFASVGCKNGLLCFLAAKNGFKTIRGYDKNNDTVEALRRLCRVFPYYNIEAYTWQQDTDIDPVDVMVVESVPSNTILDNVKKFLVLDTTESLDSVKTKFKKVHKCFGNIYIACKKNDASSQYVVSALSSIERMSRIRTQKSPHLSSEKLTQQSKDRMLVRVQERKQKGWTADTVIPTLITPSIPIPTPVSASTKPYLQKMRQRRKAMAQKKSKRTTGALRTKRRKRK